MPTVQQDRTGADAAILALIASGQATTRAALARALGWAPSTISARVQQLIDDHLVEQGEDQVGKRGRPAQHLTLATDDGCVAAIDLGGHHARLAIMSLSGVITARDDIEIDLADGPETVLGACISRLKSLATGPLSRLRAIAMSVPGPVDTSEGVIKMPARMPGWTEFTARDWLTQHTDIPAVVENDANMMAYAERVVRQDGDAPTVTVKAGTSIGAGIIVNGTIYRGATFAAGEITHYRVAAAGEAPCSCGNRGCLETIASGAALVAALRSQGVDVSSTRDVVRLAHESNPAVTTAVRAAGANLGQVLCAVVNFFNPRSIYLGGLLPTVEPFVAAVRAQIYQGSHPLLTEALTVERTRADADAILIGCGQRAIEESLGTTITTQ